MEREKGAGPGGGGVAGGGGGTQVERWPGEHSGAGQPGQGTEGGQGGVPAGGDLYELARRDPKAFVARMGPEGMEALRRARGGSGEAKEGREAEVGADGRLDDLLTRLIAAPHDATSASEKHEIVDAVRQLRAELREAESVLHGALATVERQGDEQAAELGRARAAELREAETERLRAEGANESAQSTVAHIAMGVCPGCAASRKAGAGEAHRPPQAEPSREHGSATLDPRWTARMRQYCAVVDGVTRQSNAAELAAATQAAEWLAVNASGMLDEIDRLRMALAEVTAERDAARSETRALAAEAGGPREGRIVDAAAWAEASREHADEAHAQAELTAFCDEVAAARRRHGIASFVLTTMQLVEGAKPLAGWSARGDADAWETLAAVGMRQARRAREREMAELAGIGGGG